MKTKKLLAVILSLVITISSLSFAAVSASAEGTNDITLSAVTGDPNGLNKEGYANLFDGDTGTKWCCNFSSSAYVIFKASDPVKLSKYSIATANDTADSPGRNPVEWTLSGCMNYAGTNTSWTVIDTVTDSRLGAVNKVYYNFALTETTPFYQYFKLEITKINSGNILQISEIALMEYTTPKEPSKDTGGVYQIGRASELYWFADKVNNDNANYGNASAVLTADITVNSGLLSSLKFDDNENVTNGNSFESWTPIGNYSNKYTGTFDGQNHTISGLYFNNTNSNTVINFVGLFGCLGSGGEIKNVGVIDSYFNDYNYVGGVCGRNKGTITGCYNTGTVSGKNGLGGVCGYNDGSTITGCYNTGTVSGRNRSTTVGGVCGWNSGTITGCYNIGTVSGWDRVGGVCGGNGDGGTITGCYNIGEVDCDSSYASGICGYNRSTVTDCAEYTGNEFKDGTVCALLNKAIGSDCDFIFYQGEEIPVFLSKTSYQYCTVNYAVAPTYTVTIPETVTLGQTATIKAEDVILEEEKQLKVKLTGTSGENNAFKVKSAEGAELEYTVNDGTKDISIDETVLTVNPDNSANGSATLKFNAPSDSDIIYAGKYTGTVTFTVSVADTQNS